MTCQRDRKGISRNQTLAKGTPPPLQPHTIVRSRVGRPERSALETHKLVSLRTVSLGRTLKSFGKSPSAPNFAADGKRPQQDDRDFFTPSPCQGWYLPSPSVAPSF